MVWSQEYTQHYEHGASVSESVSVSASGVSSSLALCLFVY